MAKYTSLKDARVALKALTKSPYGSPYISAIVLANTVMTEGARLHLPDDIDHGRDKWGWSGEVVLSYKSTNNQREAIIVCDIIKVESVILDGGNEVATYYAKMTPDGIADLLTITFMQL